MPEPAEMSIDELQQLADRAGLGMSRQEVEDLKSVYDLYAAYARQCHEMSFGATEMIVEYHPDWPEE
jgi:VIT1/CCC1 family predicted Fe2+/Mn2+ transporter